MIQNIKTLEVRKTKLATHKRKAIASCHRPLL